MESTDNKNSEHLPEEQNMDEGDWVQTGVQDVQGSTQLGDEENVAAIKKVKAEIQTNKDKFFLLLQEIDTVNKEKQNFENFAQKIQEGMNKQENKISEYEEELNKKAMEHKETVRIKLEENEKLEAHTQLMKERTDYFETESENLKTICLSGMEKKMVFKGNLSNNMSGLSVKHQIKYPVNGGSALITFQKPSVAAEIISARHHKVNVEDCWIHVKAEAVKLSVLDVLNMEMKLSPVKILIYNIPSGLSQEVIMDKVELCFSKTKNGGGEVEKREFLADSRSVILTFMDQNVAPGLVERKCFHVPFGENTHKVRIAPALEGNLQDYKMRKLECNRTVLITGIPDIADKDTLRDLLEIHFQKPSNGGGEVHELMYCPEGENTVALFEDDNDNVTLTE